MWLNIVDSWQTLLFLFVIFEWLLRIAMLFIVPNNRRPSSATSWLLLIMIVPTLGSLLFAMFGNPKLNKTRRKNQAVVDKLTRKELNQLQHSNPDVFVSPTNNAFAEVAKLADVLGGLPSMAGNQVTLENDYKEILRLQASAIDSAKNYIHMEYFILVLDKDTECIFEAMSRATKRGVTIRVLFDVLSARYPNHGQMKKRLNEMGVQWHKMLPLHIMPGKNFNRPDLRNHRKLLIIDGKIAFSGSANIVTHNYHRKDDLVYEEMMLRMEGPIVWQCNNVFRADWYAETKEPLLELVEKEDLPEKTGDTLMQVLPSGPSHMHSNNLMLYTSLFHAAKKRISIVVPYFVPDESVMSALVAASQRGVRVTIINSEIIDKILVGHAQRSYYDELLSAGVRILLYKKPIFLHNKQVLIDDEVAVAGSSNLDMRSFELDLELSVVIYDKAVVRQLDAIEANYTKKCIVVTEKTWQMRPLRLRLVDRITRLTAALQ
jgi:cardiolipin synthase A/B